MKLLNHTPAWLSRPAPGFQAFQGADTKAQSTLTNIGKKLDHQGPLRTLAHRGTELFYVVGNEIRWADLIALKDAAQGETQGTPFKVLKAPVAGHIRQLIISPLGDYLAIVTSHTVHVAVLPKRLDNSDGPVRLKTFQVGPTAHVLEQASLASALWHPLGVLGSCLVTVASDACVRVWELNKDSRHSFDEPALAVDLKKLANASSYGEDMRASVYGTSKGFSPDQVEMEVAAACFGGIGSSDESGWSAMTLWVAMTEGDVYALCPLLPSRWQPAASSISSLTTSVVSEAAILDQDQNASETDRRTAVQQQKWLADIDAQEPLLELLHTGLETVEVYQRPSHPPAIAKLQGPFRLHPEPDLGEISDIFVIAPRLDDDGMDDDFEDDFGESNHSGLSIGVVCLLTRSGSVHVCLDIQGVEAAWLPSRRSAFQQPFTSPEKGNLLVVETIEITASASDWPSFTPNLSTRYLTAEPLYGADPAGRYVFYVSTGHGVFSCDLTTWLPNLEEELFAPSDTGSSFRVGNVYESDITKTQQLMKFPPSSSAAAISLLDSDLGHFVLTVASNQPYAVMLDLPFTPSLLDSFAPDSAAQFALPAPEGREAYVAPREFFTGSQLPAFLDQILQQGNTRLKRADLTSQVRLSPATLQVLTEAHRILSEETNRLGLAAAELFRRCQRMQAELAEQVRRVREVDERAEYVTGRDEEGRSKQQSIEERLRKIRKRDEELQARTEALRRKVAGLSGKELSHREEAWGAELSELEGRIEGKEGQALERRVDAVRELKDGLVKKVDQALSAQGQPRGDKDGHDDGRVPSELRRKKLDQVMSLLERESALVDAVSQRLEKLSGLGSR